MIKNLNAIRNFAHYCTAYFDSLTPEERHEILKKMGEIGEKSCSTPNQDSD